MNVIRNDIENAVDKELKAAAERFGLHHSLHEKYAVTLEELEEAAAELNSCTELLQCAWDAVKCNEPKTAQIVFGDVYNHAINLACEAVQVAAMCRKEVRKPIITAPAHVNDYGVYSGKDTSYIMGCDKCNRQFVMTKQAYFCPYCGARFINAIQF